MIGFVLSVLAFAVKVSIATARQAARSLSGSFNNKTRGPYGPAGFASSQRWRAHASQVIE
jgi:hypothetical protein